MKRSRSQNVIKNMWIGTMFQIISLVLGFVSRTIFIHILGEEYLGLNSLFTNVLTILSFAELGMGNAIIFTMYKPLAEDDHPKLKKLINFYRKTYLKIGAIMIVAGLILMPFIPNIIENVPDIPENIYIIYLMFILDTSISYFFTYRTSIITADQKNYIIVTYTQIFRIFQITIQLLILYFTHNYMLYLSLQIVNTLLTQLYLSYKSKKMYPYLVEIGKNELEKSEQKDIFENVKTLFIYKFGSVILNGTDSIIISKYLGLAILGLYSNYYLLVTALTQIIAQLLNSFTSSVGNLIAKEETEKRMKIFNEILYFTAFIYCICGSCLYLMFNDFIVIWLGEKFLLSEFTVAMIVLHFCVNGMQFASFTYRNTSGEFKHYKYAAVFGAITNIVLSIWFAKIMGIGGVFLATIISRVITSWWIDPFVVYREVFKRSVKEYFLKYTKYILVMTACFTTSLFVTKYLVIDSLLMLIAKGLIIAVLTAGLFLLLTFKTPEFNDIKMSLTTILNRKKENV